MYITYKTCKFFAISFSVCWNCLRISSCINFCCCINSRFFNSICCCSSIKRLFISDEEKRKKSQQQTLPAGDELKVLQYFNLFHISVISASVAKAELMKVSIDGTLWRTKFCQQNTWLWLLFTHFKQGLIFHIEKSLWRWFVFEVGVTFLETPELLTFSWSFTQSISFVTRYQRCTGSLA